MCKGTIALCYCSDNRNISKEIDLLTIENQGLYDETLYVSCSFKVYRLMFSVNVQTGNEENSFGEFRRKVRTAQVLSPAVERLLWSLHFTGRVSVVVQNGRVLKSGYEEGYFRQHEPAAT
jgi:hypothetical protein